LCGRLSGGWQESNSANCPLPGFIVDGEPGNLVLLEFTINNLSSIRVVGDFFKISWIDSTGEIKYAQKYINWASNGAEPLSTQEWVVGFKVPSNINSFFINAGNYSAEFNNGDFSHKYIFKVDFDSKKIQDLSGS